DQAVNRGAREGGQSYVLAPPEQTERDRQARRRGPHRYPLAGRGHAQRQRLERRRQQGCHGRHSHAGQERPKRAPHGTPACARAQAGGEVPEEVGAHAYRHAHQRVLEGHDSASCPAGSAPAGPNMPISPPASMPSRMPVLVEKSAVPMPNAATAATTTDQCRLSTMASSSDRNRVGIRNARAASTAGQRSKAPPPSSAPTTV